MHADLSMSSCQHCSSMLVEYPVPRPTPFLPGCCFATDTTYSGYV